MRQDYLWLVYHKTASHLLFPYMPESVHTERERALHPRECPRKARMTTDTFTDETGRAFPPLTSSDL